VKQPTIHRPSTILGEGGRTAREIW